jgi:type IV pilus assembly protein PilZ
VDKDFEIALIVPYVSQKIQAVETFLQNTRKAYKPSVLKAINLYCWSSSDSLGIILSFDFVTFLPRYFNPIRSFAAKAGGKIYELMAFGENERKEFKNKFILTSDLKFIGDFDISFALNNILRRTTATMGRKHPRYNTTIQITFKSQEHFSQEYTKDISKGGIFVATEKPLPLNSKVELQLSLPNLSRDVKIIGEVVHNVSPEQSKGTGGNKVAGMGIQFIEFEGDGQKTLEVYFKSFSKEP